MREYRVNTPYVILTGHAYARVRTLRRKEKAKRTLGPSRVATRRTWARAVAASLRAETARTDSWERQQRPRQLRLNVRGGRKRERKERTRAVLLSPPSWGPSECDEGFCRSSRSVRADEEQRRARRAAGSPQAGKAGSSSAAGTFADPQQCLVGGRTRSRSPQSTSAWSVIGS